MTNINLQVKEAQQKPSRINIRKTTLKHITSKTLKPKDKVLKVPRE